MTVARHYVMSAQDDKVDHLRTALVQLAENIRSVEGCEGIALFQDAETGSRFVFIEYWTSVDAHKAGGSKLGKEALSAVFAALACPPQSLNLTQIEV